MKNLLAITCLLSFSASSFGSETTSLDGCFQLSESLQAPIPKPSCVAIVETGDKKIEYRFNSMGFRDKEFSSELAPGKIRIAVLGPRLFGRDLAESETPARVLEQELEKLDKGKYEVLNLSVPGFYSARYAAHVIRTLETLQPDVVIYDFWGTDLPFEWIENAGVVRGELQEIVRITGPLAKVRTPSAPILDESSEAGFAAAWRLSRLTWPHAFSNKNRAARAMESTAENLSDLAGASGLDSRFFVAWAPLASHSDAGFRAIGGAWGYLFRLLTPSLNIRGRSLTTALTQAGPMEPLFLSPEFSRPARRKLLFDDKSRLFSEQGSKSWGHWVAKAVTDEFRFSGVSSLGRSPQRKLTRPPGGSRAR